MAVSRAHHTTECSQCKAYECEIDDIAKDRDSFEECYKSAQADARELEEANAELQELVDMLKAKLDSIRDEAKY